MLAGALLWSVTTVPAQAQDESPNEDLTLEDFAEALPLSVKENRAIHTLLLPEAIYRGSVRPDFADVRIFNRAGETVPFAMRALSDSVKQHEEEVELPFFPLQAAEQEGAGSSALAFSAETRSDGSITRVNVQLKPQEGKKDGSARDIVAYLVDASQLKAPIYALSLFFESSEGEDVSNRVAQVRVEASDNLSDFRSVGRPQAVVRVAYGGEEIIRTRLEVPGEDARYLRLSWSGRLPGALVSLKAWSSKSEAHENVVTKAFDGVREGSSKNFVYDLGGSLPIDRVRVILGEDNLLIAAKIEASDSAPGPYSLLDERTYYRVRYEGALLESPPSPLKRRRAAFLRLSAQGPGASFGVQAPRLEVTRQADQLLFAERGAGPFQLAFGHHSALKSRLSVQDLLAPLPPEVRASLPLSDTEVGEAREVAGAAARLAPPEPPPWKKYALWAVLVGAVLVLGAAALSLLRSQKEEASR